MLIPILLSIPFSTFIVRAQPEIKERNILTHEAKTMDLAKALASGNAWSERPGYYDRAFWDRLPANIRQLYIDQAEEYLNYDWPVVKATDYLEFIRSGDRRQEVYAACSKALISLVMGELTEGKGRFLDQIINAVWYYSEQTWWGWSAHLHHQKAGAGLPDINDPFVDLGVGEVTSNLSWTLYLLKEEFNKVHPLIASRLKEAITKKALDPYLIRDDFWYMGFQSNRRVNNWNPWMNYNMLTSFLLIEDNEERRTKAVQKILLSLDKFLNGYPDDGGCNEGPSYWKAAGGCLFECLEILKNATNGQFDVFDDLLIQRIGKYIYHVNIHAPYFINFADADAKIDGAPSTVYRYGKAIDDEVMQKFGAYLANFGTWETEIIPGEKIGDQLRDLRLLDEIRHAEKEEAFISDFWFPDTEIAGGRDKSGSFEGFFFGAKGGFNKESHNHNDVGSCLLYFNGEPCLIDVGRETYVAKTFGSRRYEIWTMQSGYHNLPVINGVEQKNGVQFKARNSALKANLQSVMFSTDIAGAYPEAAQVKSWVRSYTLNRGKNFIVRDQYEFSELTSKPTSSNFITCCKVIEVKPGILHFEGKGFSLQMSYNPGLVRPKIEFIEVTDQKLKHYWPDGLIRLHMQLIGPSRKGNYQFTFSKIE